jgi:hypothetical protein
MTMPNQGTHDSTTPPGPSGPPAPASPALAPPVLPFPSAPGLEFGARPPRRGGLLVAGIVVAVLLVVLVGAGITAVLTLKKQTTTAATAPTAAATTAPPTAAPTPTATEPAPFTGPLQSLVLPKPSGAVYSPQMRKGDKDGVLTKQDVMSEYTGSDVDTVNTILTQDEFQRGVFLAWTDHGTLVYIQIYQFRYEREAANWNVQVQRPIQDIATSTAVFDEIPSGRWFVTKTADGRGAGHAYFSKGPFAVMIDTFKTGAADLDGTKKMALDQYKLLP